MYEKQRQTLLKGKLITLQALDSFFKKVNSI